ncbi:MAG TPA: serine/threonine-protein kinase, partial [Gemmatimonadales bacterium]|nr:serine/threonine-protein kinase [Gemmatimonadales bacterium]
IDDAVQITLEVAEALGHAHAAGIVHRDIKPENVLISGGHALVADFGIARAASEGDTQKLTQTGMAVGTPVYMSPEQAVGDPVGPTSNLYSLGCMLYEMLAGEPPFTAKNAQALMARHSMEAVPSVRIVRNTVPEEVEDAIFSAMAKVPADRPQTAAQFMELLGLPMGATASRRTSIRHTASRRIPTGASRVYVEDAVPWWRKPWILGAAALAVVGVGFAAWKVLARPAAARTSVAALAKVKRIAVLYFTADDAQLRPTADRLTESLIRSLSGVQGLSVIPRNGVAPFRERQEGVKNDSIARALDVGTLVDGSIELEGSNVRITTTIRDDAGARLESSTFLVPRDSLFKAEDSTAAEVARSLRQRIGSEIQLAESQAGTESVEAWTLRNRAENSRRQATEAGARDPARAATLFAEADSLLQEASLKDRLWVEPIVLRGEVALQRARLEREPAGRLPWIQSGRGYADSALAQDPENARALALLGTAEYGEWGVTRLTKNPVERAALLKSAEEHLLSAVGRDQTLAAAYATLSFVYYDLKDVSNALIMARNAYTADRFLSNADLILFRLYLASYDTQQFADARNHCAEGAVRFPQDWRFVSCRLWLMLSPQQSSADSIPVAWRLLARGDSLGTPMQKRMGLMLVGGVIGKAARDGNNRPLADSARRVLERAAQPDPNIDPTQELMGYEAVMLA